VLEVECGEQLLSMIPAAEMCKFAKDGSTATTAAIKLARAKTGRDKIAYCGDHPFFPPTTGLLERLRLREGFRK
jgi:glutamate-1-semialdehyde 2,1-aminomutase